MAAPNKRYMGGFLNLNRTNKKNEVRIMSITIYGLDDDYADCVCEMEAKIYPHDGVIDCKFSETVDIAIDDTTVNLIEGNTGMGMSLGFDDFFTIQID